MHQQHTLHNPPPQLTKDAISRLIGTCQSGQMLAQTAQKATEQATTQGELALATEDSNSNKLIQQ